MLHDLMWLKKIISKNVKYFSSNKCLVLANILFFIPVFMPNIFSKSFDVLYKKESNNNGDNDDVDVFNDGKIVVVVGLYTHYHFKWQIKTKSTIILSMDQNNKCYQQLSQIRRKADIYWMEKYLYCNDTILDITMLLT